VKKVNALIVRRETTTGDISTSEIQRLAESAGYTVVETITQRRSENSEYNIGSGKLAEVRQSVKQNSVTVVIFDNELDAYQKYNIGIYLPENVFVLDRYSLILDLFEKRATDKHGQIQVKLARLRYELPRAEVKSKLSNKSEKPGFMGLGEYDDDEAEDIKSRISRTKAKLQTIEQNKQRAREERRDSGFDLVSIAGYTNAGKSTLFRRLCERRSVDENEKRHGDLNPVAESADELFTTLNTKVGRLDDPHRNVLLTDTVGFISRTPEWMIESFKSTLNSVYDSDLVLITIDATEPVSGVHEKMSTVKGNVRTRKSKSTKLQTVFTKFDEIGDEKQDDLLSIDPNAVFVSAEGNNNVNKVKQAIHNRLPPLEKKTLSLKPSTQTMSLVSWIYDNAFVTSKEYDESGSVRIEFEGKPKVINKAVSKKEAQDLGLRV
jgi:GTP-binding protein HflX